MRAFIAVPVEPPAHAEVAALVGRLHDSVEGVRWVQDSLHITLHFFADLEDSRYEEVVAAMGAAASAATPFVLRPGGLGSFPPRGHPRVLWLGLSEHSPALERLAADLGRYLSIVGFPLERRPFRPHVTLGRPRPRFDEAAWRSAVASPPAVPPFRVSELILYESREGHHVRARAPIGGA